MLFFRHAFLTGLLAAGFAPAAPASATPGGVSPRMVALIAEYKHLSAILDGLNADEDLDAWADAADAATTAMTALVNERPATMADFAAKFRALLEVTKDDSEFHILRRLSEDADALVETR
jgi:hypothetical protein